MALDERYSARCEYYCLRFLSFRLAVYLLHALLNLITACSYAFHSRLCFHSLHGRGGAWAMICETRPRPRSWCANTKIRLHCFARRYLALSTGFTGSSSYKTCSQKCDIVLARIWACSGVFWLTLNDCNVLDCNLPRDSIYIVVGIQNA